MNRTILRFGAVALVALFLGASATAAVVGFTPAHGRIVAIDLIADPQKLRGLALEPQD